jgi:hypothetical protein
MALRNKLLIVLTCVFLCRIFFSPVRVQEVPGDQASIEVPPEGKRSNDPGRILLFITTHFSKLHIDYLHCCWPKLLEKSTLLKHAEVLFYSSNLTVVDEKVLHYSKQLFQNNPSFRIEFIQEHDIKEYLSWDVKSQKQWGANLGVSLGFSEQWFAPYDWVIRVNPDVLIRDGRWMWETMHDDSAKALLWRCTGQQIHTDFFAVRPRAVSNTSFTGIVNISGKINHEMTAMRDFKHLLNNGNRLMPGLDNSGGVCRLRGERAPVIHDHSSCKNSSMICNALEGWDVY